MRLVWAQHALADRDTIFKHIEAENPRAAVNVDNKMSQLCGEFSIFQRVVAPAALWERGRLSFLAPLISLSILSSLTRYEFCAFCTARKPGQTISIRLRAPPP
jgi:toxin ParE1/3/4